MWPLEAAGAAAYSRLRKNALAGANSFGDAPLRRGSPRGTRRTMSGYRSKQRGLGRVGGLVAAALLLGLAACSSDEPPAYVEKPVEELYNGAMHAMQAGEYDDAARLFDEVERQHTYSAWAAKLGRAWYRERVVQKV